MYALLSVSDKSHLEEFAKGLVELGYKIISTGGTRKHLASFGIETVDISDVTGFPEMMDGRVKTLHPNIHGGLLALRDSESHIKAARSQGIEFIDVVAVNLYPFKETVSKGCDYSEAIENIDIGGPSMLRSAAKNHKFVTTVCDPSDYSLALAALREDSYEVRKELAAKVFRHTAQYDTYIANYLTEGVKESLTMTFDLVDTLRYGENPHQEASFYKSDDVPFSVATANKLHGKKLSYNNIQDSNATLEIISEYDEPAVVAVKHMNPCGVGTASTIEEAWDKAYSADPVSIFGGIIALNRNVTKYVAEEINKIFVEIVMAPSFDEDALEVLKKKKNVRILTVDMSRFEGGKKFVSVTGGLLVQDRDITEYEYSVVTEKAPTKEEMTQLEFLMKACKHVKSNAIVVGRNNQTTGVGAGQMYRYGAAKLALEWSKVHHGDEEIYLASDAFFPFDDVVELAAKYNVKAIIQPGGSIKDGLSIDKCNELGIAMVFTGKRHFKH